MRRVNRTNMNRTNMFQSSPGGSPGCDYRAAERPARGTKCFNPHPGVAPGATPLGPTEPVAAPMFQSSPGGSPGCDLISLPDGRTALCTVSILTRG